MNILQEIIDRRGLDPEDVAAVLFPALKHPLTGLERVIEGKQLLNSMQLVNLSKYLLLPVRTLLSEDWDTTVLAGQPDKVVCFRTDIDGNTHKALLDSSTGLTVLFCNNRKTAEVSIHAKSITLTDYIDFLNHLIITNES